MSCFVVSSLTMSRVLAGVRFMGALSVSVPEREAARYLWTLNAWAHEERYPGRYEEERALPRYIHAADMHKGRDPAQAFAIYKAMRCLAYQCAEGAAYESSAFDWLEKQTDAFALYLSAEFLPASERFKTIEEMHECVQRSRFYADAPWGE